MRFFSAIGLATWPALISMAISGCGSTQSGTNIDVSNDAASASLTSRLAKSAWVAQRFDSIRSGLTPAASIFGDAATSATSSAQWLSPADKVQVSQILREIPARLNTLLSEAGAGLATLNPDGSWSIDRDTSLALGRDPYSCGTSQLSVTGKDITGGRTTFLVSLSDCETGGTIPVLGGEFDAVAGSDNQFTTELTLYPATLGSLSAADVQEGACSGHSDASGSSFHCDPIEIVSIPQAGFSIEIEDLDFRADATGIQGTVRMSAQENGNVFWSWSEKYPIVSSANVPTPVPATGSVTVPTPGLVMGSRR